MDQDTAIKSSLVMVDTLTPCANNSNWRWDKACHMTCRDIAALHSFAKQIGLRREWFQNHPKLPHYDLNATRRRAAVQAGAVEITREQLCDEMDHWHEMRQLERAAKCL